MITIISNEIIVNSAFFLSLAVERRKTDYVMTPRDLESKKHWHEFKGTFRRKMRILWLRAFESQRTFIVSRTLEKITALLKFEVSERALLESPCSCARARVYFRSNSKSSTGIDAWPSSGRAVSQLPSCFILDCAFTETSSNESSREYTVDGTIIASRTLLFGAFDFPRIEIGVYSQCQNICCG